MTSNAAMRFAFFALAVVSLGCSSSSGDPSSGGDGGADTTHGDVADDTTFHFDAAPPDNGCPLAFDPASIDCDKACANYAGWCDATSCKSPYCSHPTDCPTACNVTKSETGYTNALFGCAAQYSDCSRYETCVLSTCPSP